MNQTDESRVETLTWKSGSQSEVWQLHMFKTAALKRDNYLIYNQSKLDENGQLIFLRDLYLGVCERVELILEPDNNHLIISKNPNPGDYDQWELERVIRLTRVE